MPEPTAAVHPSSVAAVLPPGAWIALAQALEPAAMELVRDILARFAHQPPAPAPAPPA